MALRFSVTRIRCCEKSRRSADHLTRSGQLLAKLVTLRDHLLSEHGPRPLAGAIENAHATLTG
jgi:hypothetical protein